ncbi:MAG: glycosyltransferase family 2 protein [Methylophilaceae bacterium]|jgi:glycosyltransferase involved in cell wall biosynthesis
MSISVIVITKNEEQAIHECLSSVSWADEIIVVDSGSTDDTVQICKSFGAQIIVTEDWPGFGVQKNRALALATCNWVLSIDADERVSKVLQNEILKIIKLSKTDTAFRIPRHSSFCGQFINHSGWWPDYVLRLIPNPKHINPHQNQAKFSNDMLHERIIFDGQISTLNNPIIHISYSNLEDVLSKMDRYSSDGAAMAYARGEQSSLSKALRHSSWAFVRTYLLRLGFLDGKMGFILALSNAQTTYYRYLKLMMLSNKNK